ncbi:MAG: hypothetical protein ACPGVK_05835 [Halocynthiibacter sp.]
MSFIADIFLIAGTLGAGFYCLILSRRLSRFGDLKNGVGGAVAALSIQVEEMTDALDAARSDTEASRDTLLALIEKAERISEGITRELEDTDVEESAKVTFIRHIDPAPQKATGT